MQVFLLLLFSIVVVSAHGAVDFDRSMGRGKPEFAVCQRNEGDYGLASPDNNAIDTYYQFKQLYNKAVLHTVQKTVRIPRIIHAIWLGGPLPALGKRCLKSWALHHPDWTIILWVDNPCNYHHGECITVAAFEQNGMRGAHLSKRFVIDVAQLPLHNRAAFDDAKNYGRKSDILKWELIYRYGGLYVDTDFMCLASFDRLHYTYDFYTGIQPLDIEVLALGAALFAARPQHPILARCVFDIDTYTNVNENRSWIRLSQATGPIHFTRCFLKALADDTAGVIAFPASFFYPIGMTQKNGPLAYELYQPESMAAHYWQASWLHE